MNKKKKFLVLLIVVVVVLIFSSCKRNTKEDAKDTIERTDFMMDTIMTIKIFDNKDEKILDEAFERIEEIENRMSRTIETSYVYQINKNAGIKPVRVSDDVYYVLKKAKYYAEISKGAYEPTIGPLVDLWNIQGKGENKKCNIPSEDKILTEKDKVDFAKLKLLEDNQVFLCEKDMKLDLGGIVKGYAADEVKKILKKHGVKNAIIDLGGNIYTLGSSSVGQDWKIGIQNPFDNIGDYVGIVKVQDKSIVTSGDYERYFEVNGIRYHHIIDKKTGYPTNNELSAVSVISDKSIDGDALSTTLFVLGKEKGMKFVNELEGVEAIFITKDYNIYITPKLKEKFTLTNTDFKLK